MDPLSILAVIAAAAQFADIGVRLLTHVKNRATESQESQLQALRVAARNLTKGINTVVSDAALGSSPAPFHTDRLKDLAAESDKIASRVEDAITHVTEHPRTHRLVALGRPSKSRDLDPTHLRTQLGYLKSEVTTTMSFYVAYSFLLFTFGLTANLVSS